MRCTNKGETGNVFYPDIWGKIQHLPKLVLTFLYVSYFPITSFNKKITVLMSLSSCCFTYGSSFLYGSTMIITSPLHPPVPTAPQHTATIQPLLHKRSSTVQSFFNLLPPSLLLDFVTARFHNFGFGIPVHASVSSHVQIS